MLCVLGALALAASLLGPHPVGYESLFVRDVSRPDIEATTLGRPVHISIWFPAADGRGATMHLADYVELLGAYETGSPRDGVGRRRFVETAKERAHGESEIGRHLEKLLSLRTTARRGVRPARGKFPVVVFPEYRAPATNSIMAEALASHGFAVLSIPMIGTFEFDYEGGVTGIETHIADLRFAIHEVARRYPAIDASRLGLIGVGIAANIAIAYQTRNPTVDAIVSLEGGLPSPFENSLMQRTPYYDTAILRAPMLIIQAPFEGRDDALLHQYRFADRWLIEFPTMKEYYFLNYGPLDEHAPGVLGPPPGAVAKGFSWATRHVLAFLDRTLRDGSSKVEEGPAGLFTIRFEKARPAIPTAQELKRIIQKDGVEGLKRVYESLKSEESRPFARQTLFDLANFFGWQRDNDWAIRRELMSIASEIYPESARARFALANACRARRETSCAIKAYEETLRVLPEDRDSSLDAAARERLSRLAAERRDALRTAQ